MRGDRFWEDHILTCSVADTDRPPTVKNSKGQKLKRSKTPTAKTRVIYPSSPSFKHIKSSPLSLFFHSYYSSLISVSCCASFKVRVKNSIKKWEKTMDNNTNITIVVHFNGSIIINIEYSVIFMFHELAYFLIPQTMSFKKLNVGICQGINVGTQEIVVRIRYRCLISNLNNIQYQPIKISNDRDMQIIFETYRQY